MSSAETESSAAERREALKEVFSRASVCERCPELAATRKTVVFGSGNADAELMFIGEAPGASEDEQGIPFVGRAGKLLEKLLVEVGLERSEVFVANTLQCRPPGNRDPLPIELENCHEYLLRKVELIQPTVICTLGNFSTKLLRGDPTGITRLHGQPQILTLGAPEQPQPSEMAEPDALPDVVDAVDPPELAAEAVEEGLEPDQLGLF